MAALESAISLIITLGILVTIHEFGHFWVARRCGVKVLRFSVGFGKPLFSWHDKLGTEYAVAAIPLGGYVKMLDEREGPVPEEQRHEAFSSKPVKQRIAIAAAGPLANFIFAIAAYWLMFMLGFNVVMPKIGAIEEGSIADQAGLRAGMVVEQIEEREAYSWREVVMGLVNRLGDTGEIQVHARTEGGVSSAFALPIDGWLAGESHDDMLASLGISPYRPAIPAIVGQLVSGGPAEGAGLKVGDRIIEANGSPIEDWFALVDIIQDNPAKKVDLTVQRAQTRQEVELSLIPDSVASEDGGTVGKIGVGVAPFEYPTDMVSTVRYPVHTAFVEATNQTWNDIAMTLGAVKKMVVGLISLDNLSGPITIARVASQSISTGAEEFLRFLALLSVSLGVLNLLPIPVLDGGHILFYLVEAVRGKALSEKSQILGIKIGMSLVLMLMVIAFYNDIMRL